MVKLLSNEQQELHQVTLLPSVLLNLLAIFQDASLIAKLLKTFLEFLWGCLAGIILYCDRLVWHRSLNALDTLLKKRRLLLILFSQASQCICGVVVNTMVLMSLAKVTIATIIIMNITKIFFITFLFALIIQL